MHSPLRCRHSAKCTEFSFFFSFFFSNSLSPHSLLVWSIGRPTAVSISFPQNWLVWSDTFLYACACVRPTMEWTRREKNKTFFFSPSLSRFFRQLFAKRNYVEFTSVRWELSSGNHRRRCLFVHYVTFEFLSFGCFTLVQWPLQCERLVSFFRSRTVFFFSSPVNLWGKYRSNETRRKYSPGCDNK